MDLYWQQLAYEKSNNWQCTLDNPELQITAFLIRINSVFNSLNVLWKQTLALITVFVKGISGRRWGTHPSAARDQDDSRRGECQITCVWAYWTQDHGSTRGVQSSGSSWLHTLLPHCGDELRQCHVSKLTQTVPYHFWQLNHQVSRNYINTLNSMKQYIILFFL